MSLQFEIELHDMAYLHQASVKMSSGLNDVFAEKTIWTYAGHCNTYNEQLISSNINSK